MAPSSVRVLHYVLKVGDRDATVHFLHDVLGMHALRHEEFREGCKAACNGPHDGLWSKTMMGYDSEVRLGLLLWKGSSAGCAPAACWD